MTTPASPRFSLAGWNWRTYLAKTKTGLKWVLGLLVAYLAVVILPIEPLELRNLLGGVLGYVSKLGADLLDYWLTEDPS